MANTIKRMSRSQARRRETPLFLAVLDLVDQAVEDDDAEDERQPPAHRVHWPSQEGN